MAARGTVVRVATEGAAGRDAMSRARAIVRAGRGGVPPWALLPPEALASRWDPARGPGDGPIGKPSFLH